MTFPKIYQRIVSCVNDVSMTIDVPIATVISGVSFDYLLSFFSLFFSVFYPSFVKKNNPLLFCAHFDSVCFLEQIHIFFDVVIVNCGTAGSGSKMAASNSKWRVCDAIMTSRHVIIDTS